MNAATPLGPRGRSAMSLVPTIPRGFYLFIGYQRTCACARIHVQTRQGVRVRPLVGVRLTSRAAVRLATLGCLLAIVPLHGLACHPGINGAD